MLSELLQDRAALYVAGAMTAPERESFELVLEVHEALRAHVAELQKAGTALLTARPAPVAAPPADLKARLLGAIETHPRQTEPDAFVRADPEGRVEWFNPAFAAMCGYSAEEIQGRKPGELLQGPETDPAAVQRIRESLRARRPCRETLVNYHKDGSRYEVDVAITPILDEEGEPLWFVAKERKLQTAG
jgi:PAS domain S-box-containing protein